MTLQALLNEAEKLSPQERWELVDELLRMAHDERAGDELTPAQAADLQRRLEEVRSGKAKLIPADEAFEMLRKRT